MSRLRTSSRFLFSALLAATTAVSVTACTSEPLPGLKTTADELRLTALLGRHHNPFGTNDVPNAPDSTGGWNGRWLVDGHLISFQASFLPATQLVDRAYLFGYSWIAKRYFMITVVSADAGDRADVAWFSIKGDNWVFEPEPETVDGKAVYKQKEWNSKTHEVKVTTVATRATLPPLPPPRKELVGSSRVDLQACKLEYSIVSPK